MPSAKSRYVRRKLRAGIIHDFCLGFSYHIGLESFIILGRGGGFRGNVRVGVNQTSEALEAISVFCGHAPLEKF